MPAYELTFGGPDPARTSSGSSRRAASEQLDATTPLPTRASTTPRSSDDQRGEGKLTYAINPKNTAKFSYLRQALATTNDSFSTIMDQASLYDDTVDESLLAANYQCVLTNNLFFEAQYSARMMDTIGVGSRYMDLLKGTPIWDRSRGQARFSAPTYCAVCPDAVNLLNNWDVYGKLNYFLSTEQPGARTTSSAASTSSRTCGRTTRTRPPAATASRPPARSSTARTSTRSSAPVRPPTSNGCPVFEPTLGNDLRTYSGFFNDTWRVNQRINLTSASATTSNSTSDQGGKPVGNATIFSPRSAATFDLTGDGKWLAQFRLRPLRRRSSSPRSPTPPRPPAARRPTASSTRAPM